MRANVREQLAGLVRMELVRPDQAAFVGEEAYRFRHLLIRDAAYQAIAKQSRSELHERFADWLERMAADRAVEFEEIIAYHFEQAFRYRAELGPPDSAALDLAQRAGNLLADAGERASRRGDMGATRELLTRAMDLLSPDQVRRRRLVLHLGPALYLGGDAPSAEQTLTRAMAEADEAGDEGASALAAVILTAVRTSTESTEQVATLRDFEHLADILERTGDEGGARLARAWAAFSMFASGRAGEASERAAALVELGPSDEIWYGEARATLGTSLVNGPVRVEEAVRIIGELEARGGRAGSALGGMRGRARLRTLQGRFDESRELLARSRSAEEELGNRHQLASNAGAEADVEHVAGDDAAAARLGIEAYRTLTASGDKSYASTIAVGIAEALIGLEDLDEAWKFATIARETSSSDDVISQAGGRATQARVLSRRGDHDAAVRLAREADAIMATTDYLAQHGMIAEHLAHVLHAAGKGGEAVEVARRAEELYDRKGATFLVERVDRLIAEWEAA